MPRNYKKAVKRPSPSGLPCRRCGALESSGWRGINSRLCAKNTCKAEAAAESGHTVTEKQVPPVHESGDASSKAVPMAHDAVAVPLTAPIHGVPLAVPVPVAAVASTAIAAHLAQATAVPLSAPLVGVPTAAPLIPVAPTAPAAGTKRAAARVPLSAISGNTPRTPDRRKQDDAAEATGDGCGLCTYERERQANIERNAKKLRELGLDAMGVEGLRVPRPPPKPRAPPKPPPPTDRNTRSSGAASAAVAPTARQGWHKSQISVYETLFVGLDGIAHAVLA